VSWNQGNIAGGDTVINLTDLSSLLANFGKIYTPATATPIPPTATLTSTPTPVGPTPTSGPLSSEWTQHAFNAEHTSYNPTSIPTPWRWKWSWNGPNSSGGVSKVTSNGRLPSNVQPVTGGGRVYIAAGIDGIYALNQTDGSQAWSPNPVSPGGSINSTLAYDSDTNSIFAVSSNGSLYKLNASTGTTTASFNGSASGTSTLPLPPTITGDTVFFSMGNNVYTVKKTTMQQVWSYPAGSPVNTPPAYSLSKNRVVVVTQDLFVHAINNTNGQQAWRAKPTNRVYQSGLPNTSGAQAEYGWPVIAEQHGYVLIKYRLDWDTMWTWNPWPTTNSQIRTNLQTNPGQQTLYVMNLDNGTVPFISNIGHGGWGDGGNMPMGPQPVVKKFTDNTEVVYTVIRGDSRNDGRWDSLYGEMVLDGTTISGLQPGFIRWIQYGNYGWPTNSNHDSHPTDEQPQVSMAGDHLFGGHWAMYDALRILDRSTARGSYTNPITSSALPHVVSTTTTGGCGNASSASSNHYCNGSTIMLVPPDEYRAVPNNGFYMYWNAGKIYDSYWSNYSVWTVSNGLILVRSNDGAIVALENGTP
jgi:outer membrane protein assembly factor BamB